MHKTDRVNRWISQIFFWVTGTIRFEHRKPTAGFQNPKNFFHSQIRSPLVVSYIKGRDIIKFFAPFRRQLGAVLDFEFCVFQIGGGGAFFRLFDRVDANVDPIKSGFWKIFCEKQNGGSQNAANVQTSDSGF